MKKLAASILVAVLLFAGMTYAQTATQADSAARAQQQASEQQTIAAINALIGYVGKYATPADSAAQAKDTTGNKHATWGGIFDKALGMFSGAISKIAETLEQAAPYVWKIMVLQQYAKAAGGIAIPLGFLLFLFFYHHYINKWWTGKADETFDEMSSDSSSYSKSTGQGWGFRVFFCRFIPLVGGLFVGGFLISAIQNAVLYTMNPYYYAIRDMIVLLLGTSHGM